MGYENEEMNYRDAYEESNPFAIDAVREDRAAFIRRTYAHLTGAIFCFAGLLYVFCNNETISNGLFQLWGIGNGLLVLGLFLIGSWVARAWAMNGGSQTIQYTGLALYTVLEAVIFTPLVYYVVKILQQPDVITSAGILTLIIFGGLTAFVMVTGADFSFLRGILFLGSLLAFGAIILGMFMGFQLGIWFSVAMIGLCAGYILYDTSNVLMHYRTDQHVAAALGLFASIATMFWYMIQLLLSFAGDD